MTHHQTSVPARYVEWARKGICTWFSARKHVVQLYRDGMDVAQICLAVGVDRQWMHKWIGRFKAGGRHWDALRDRPSRPHKIHATRHAYRDQVMAAKQEYPHLGVVKLQLVAQLPIGHSTVHKILQENGALKRVKRIWKKWRRFCRPYANYLWQIDITQVPTKNGRWCFIATVLDDHSRCILASRCYEQDLTQADTIQLVRDTIRQWGKPRQILTDHGCQFDQVAEAPSLFTQALAQWEIRHIMGRPYHPQTQGKIERWHRSLKHEWFGYHEVQADMAGVRLLLESWLEHYNTVRPHWSLDLRTPLEVYLESSSTTHEVATIVNGVSG